jgi:hypothetical protein
VQCHLDAGALARRPGALGDLADQAHLLRRPLAGFRLLHAERRDLVPVLEQRVQRDGTGVPHDPLRSLHLAHARVGRRVGDDHRLAAAKLRAHPAIRLRVVVEAFRERRTTPDVLSSHGCDSGSESTVDLGVGRPVGAEVVAQQA